MTPSRIGYRSVPVTGSAERQIQMTNEAGFRSLELLRQWYCTFALKAQIQKNLNH